MVPKIVSPELQESRQNFYIDTFIAIENALIFLEAPKKLERINQNAKQWLFRYSREIVFLDYWMSTIDQYYYLQYQKRQIVEGQVVVFHQDNAYSALSVRWFLAQYNVPLLTICLIRYILRSATSAYLMRWTLH